MEAEVMRSQNRRSTEDRVRNDLEDPGGFPPRRTWRRKGRREEETI